MSRPHRKKSLKRYLTQYGHLKKRPNCLESVEEVPGYMCYRFQHFICKRAATGKVTHDYTINQSSWIVGLKTKHMLIPKRYSLLKKSNYQRINDSLDINK